MPGPACEGSPPPPAAVLAFVCGALIACAWKYARREDMNKPISILFVGDVVGGIGRRTLLGLLPSLHERLAPDFIVVNGENSAGGLGITPKIAEQMFASGVHAITL